MPESELISFEEQVPVTYDKYPVPEQYSKGKVESPPGPVIVHFSPMHAGAVSDCGIRSTKRGMNGSHCIEVRAGAVDFDRTVLQIYFFCFLSLARKGGYLIDCIKLSAWKKGAAPVKKVIR